ncbi:MAG: hypothetical protein AUG49_20305 [Catenulispora sp. 13_1_20CM_3_70_7]|nr:MAG: hypothetical protein AUG49_20305 [Catenulispora sp. 13_1_20CM_3_70_7]
MAHQDEHEPTVAKLAGALGKMVREVMAEIRPRLVEAALTGERGESKNLRHTDNFLSRHDLWMHEEYRRRVAELLPSFVYASEEADPQVIGEDPDPDLCVLVDPLDTSELAVRGLFGYTHIMVYSRFLARPIAAVVGDIFHHIQLYLAARGEDGVDRAYVVTADGQATELRVRPAKPLNEALITTYLMRPAERFSKVAAQQRLIAALAEPAADGKARGRIGVDFGSISLCHVAAGMTDATAEFAKGFAIWDLAPGHYILHAAGGAVIDLDGKPVPLDAGFTTLADIGKAMKQRQKFIAAPDAVLAAQIRDTLDT